MRRWVKGAAIRRAAVNIGLLLTSCLIGLSLCEASLRLFYPKYRHLAEAQFRSDAMRIWARTPHSRDWRNHPDTDVPHSFNHNNLALRQHRDFNEADLASATNIGVFGDSFTENTSMPVEYSFTEPLDYLLNQSGRPFNVLNFGVDGYGPGQSLLHYEYFHHAEDLDHVFFVYFWNDLPEMSITNLFDLDEAGHLVRNPKFRSSPWVSLMSRLHISYLVLDISGRAPFLKRHIMEAAANNEKLRHGPTEDQTYISIRDDFGRGNPAHDSQSNSWNVFQQVIRHWKHSAELNGSTFSVVLLPDQPQPAIRDLLEAEDVEILDLYACFGDADPAHLQRPWTSSPYRFKNDGHWNEAGNGLAAICLYRMLEEKMDLPKWSEADLWEALFDYYMTFRGEISLKIAGRGRGRRTVSPETAAAIRKKYLALDISNLVKDVYEETVEVVPPPGKRIIASDFDVYLDHNRLTYIKEGFCPTAPQRFFLHVVPMDERDLPEHRRQYGFDNLDFWYSGVRLDDKTCQATKLLPAYAIRSILTGQYIPGKARLWESKYVMEQAAVEQD